MALTSVNEAWSEKSHRIRNPSSSHSVPSAARPVPADIPKTPSADENPKPRTQDQ